MIVIIMGDQKYLKNGGFFSTFFKYLYMFLKFVSKRIHRGIVEA